MQQPSSGLVATSSHGDDSSPWSIISASSQPTLGWIRLDQYHRWIDCLHQSISIQRISYCCHLCNPQLSLYWFPLVPPSQQRSVGPGTPDAICLAREERVDSCTSGAHGKAELQDCCFVGTRMKQPLQMLAVNPCITHCYIWQDLKLLVDGLQGSTWLSWSMPTKLYHPKTSKG